MAENSRQSKQLKLSDMFILPSSSHIKKRERTEEEEEDLELRRSKMVKETEKEILEIVVESKVEASTKEPHQQSQTQEDSQNQYFDGDESFEKALLELTEYDNDYFLSHPIAGAQFEKQIEHNLTSIAPSNEELIDTWNQNKVKLPCARKNCFRESITNKLTPKWPIIKKSLSANIQSVEDLKIAICQYNQKYYDDWDFSGLSLFIDSFSEEERSNFFKDLLPRIVKLCLELPQLLPESIPLLESGISAAITLTQKQVACILANAFFCTFPRRNSKTDSDFANYPTINFNVLYERYGRGYPPKMASKMKCLLHYFDRVTSEDHSRHITFKRRVLNTAPKWQSSTKKLRKILPLLDGSIEEQGEGMHQVDFANKYIGGGVIGHGSVQEEIRFSICPELIASRLFIEQIKSNESVEIIGAERYSSYQGYADTFSWTSSFHDTSPIDSKNRISTTIIAIDAIDFRNIKDQFTEVALKRELNKSFCGFYSEDEKCNIASGLWGCGVFKGVPELKALIQMMSASISERDLAFFCYGRDDTYVSIIDINQVIEKNNWANVSHLYNCIIDFCRNLSSHSDQNQIGKDLVSFVSHWFESNKP